MTFPIDNAPPNSSSSNDGPCPNCRTRLEDQEGGFHFVKNAIIKVNLRTRLAAAKCPQYKRWVEVRLQLAGP